MKTKQEIKAWLLENCVDKYGDLDLNGLDFSDFNGDVYIRLMKVKKDLFQDCQKVEGNLWQCNQETQGNIHQDNIKEIKINEIIKFISAAIRAFEKELDYLRWLNYETSTKSN